MQHHKLPTIFALLLSLCWAPATSAMVHDPRAIDADPATATTPIAPRLAGLGMHSHPVTTDSPDSQYFFDQGLRLTYGFNHSEALRSFKEAARLDPDNAMAYWGWALVLGPNINLPMQDAVAEQAYAAIQQAIERKANVSDIEAAYIDALASRYAPVAPADRTPLDKAYADAMKALTQRFPDDEDAATLYGAALMNLSPWDYWRGDGRPKEATKKIIETFETVLAKNPEHPGAIHYYIHTMEVAKPAEAESAADVLATLMPGAGHMVHMPSHIYMRVGRYADSFTANRAASDADAGYIAQCNAQGIYPLNYYPHNLHFMVWSAMFQGRSSVALAGAREVEAAIPKTVGTLEGTFETFLSQPLYVMVRFGLWDQVLAEPEPAPQSKFVQGVRHYARGMAFSNTGKRRDAQKELRALRKLRNGLGADYLVGFANAPTLLTIAEHVLAGDIANAKGDHDAAVTLLERAVRLEDSLRYSEPPDWYFPTRHVLGALLIEAGYPREAEAVYWQDLRKSPDNGYALLGLSQALSAQGRTAEAESAAAEFKIAWRAADKTLTSSRF